MSKRMDRKGGLHTDVTANKAVILRGQMINTDSNLWILLISKTKSLLHI